MQPSRERLAWFLIAGALAFLFAISLFSGRLNRPPTVPLSQVVEEVRRGEVAKIEVTGDRLEVFLKDGRRQLSHKEANTSLKDSGISPEAVTVEVRSQARSALLYSLLSGLLPIALLLAFFWFISRQMAVGNTRALTFGQSRARLIPPGKTKVTFKDVGGLEEAKQELVEVVEFLKNPERFQALGAEVPKGVLLTGPSGTGKTLLAKAVAGEANVPFFSISASEFVEMFVGVGSARVRDLFSKAKRNAPAIIFIDELDAVGRTRGTGLVGTHDEREQTLNQILVEMDGFESDTRVIILGSTNRPDILDPALLRPGRFDRKVVLDLPDVKERQAILEIHTRTKKLEPSVNLSHLAKITAGFSGADLRNLANEAAILAARRGKRATSQRELEEAIEKVLLGPERKSHLLSDREKRITAYHEAGHALVAHFLPHCDPVHKVSIIARGPAAGYTLGRPEEDRRLRTAEEFRDNLAQLLGGRAAEELILGDVSSGAADDLRKATRIAREMILRLGMSKLGPVSWGDGEEVPREFERVFSEETSAAVDREVRRLLDEAKRRARETLTRHRSLLDHLATALVKEETIEGAKLERLLGRRPAKTGEV